MATDFYLTLDTIKGESLTVKDAIEIQSFSWGASQSGTAALGSGGGAGKVSMQDFHFVMINCSASPELLLACATGRHIPKAHLELRKASGNVGKQATNVYLTVDFEDFMVSSYQTGGSTGGELPMDQVSLNFSKITYEYFTQDAKGVTKSAGKSSFDLKTGTGKK